MLKMSSLSLNGTSRIEEKDVVYFNASFSDGSAGFVITKNVTDAETYKKNKIQCEADYDEFEEKAMQYVGGEDELI